MEHLESEEIVNNERLSVMLSDDDLVTLTFRSMDISATAHIELAQEVREVYYSLKDRFPNKNFKVLVDLTNAGVPPKKVSDSYIKTLSDRHIEKTAIYGMGSAIKSIVTLITSAAGKGDQLRFFIDKEEALAWLKGVETKA
jgi:hypothetical protein